MSVTITGPINRVCTETLGRQRAYQWADLDRLEVLYIGPAYSLENFPVKSPHPEYPLMFVLSAQEQSFEGGLTRLQVTYEGKLFTKGQSTYISEPVTTESSVQGSRDFIQYVITQQYPASYLTSNTPSGPVVSGNAAGYSYGTQSIAVRYIGNQCSVRYQSYPHPSGPNYSSLGLSRVNWTVISTTKGAVSVVGQGMSYDMCSAAIATLQSGSTSGVPPLYARLMGFEIEQRGKWYNCAEIYAPTF